MPVGNSFFWHPNTGNTFLPKASSPYYAHPYEDMASVSMPSSIHEALKWSQFISLATGPYRSALHRVVAYCITDIEVKERPGSDNVIGKEVRENYEKVFSDDCLKLKKETLDVGMDLLTYGNAFVSVFTGFKRYLSCQGKKNGRPCGAQIPIQTMLENKGFYKFSFDNLEFKAQCPYCGRHGSWKVHDLPSKSTSELFIHRWNPLDIDILYDPFSKQSSVIWNIPSDYIADVRRGASHVITTIPLEILEAIKEDGKFKFNPEMILHLKTGSLSGLNLKGWGLPSTIANFRQAWMYQVCTRHTETTAMESLAPLRIISPPGDGGPKDPVHNVGAPAFVNTMKNILNTKRRDPASCFVTPFPVQYQTIGGDASQFIPRDLLDYTLDNLLTSAGVPVELYKGSMTMQSAPVALRLFTSHWQSLVTDLNRFVRFVAQRVSDILGWEPVDVQYSKITQADDINRQVQALQLMSTGAVSRTTALASVGMDQKEEAQLMIEEQRSDAELQDRMQKELETTKQLDDMVGGGTLNVLSRQQGQQASPMGMPGQNMPVPGAQMAGATIPGANGQGMSSLLPGQDPISQMIAQAGVLPTDSLDDVYAKAQVLAQQFLSAGNTNSALRKLKQQDTKGSLYAMTKELIEQTRQNAASQGRDMILQQQMGGGM